MIAERFLVPGWKESRTQESVIKPVSGYIYFLATDDGRHVKIGFSEWPEVRLAKLHKWSPVKLRLLAYVPGKRGDEWFLHSLFQRYWLHYEWFEAVPPIVMCANFARRLGRLPVSVRSGCSPPTGQAVGCAACGQAAWSPDGRRAFSRRMKQVWAEKRAAVAA